MPITKASSSAVAPGAKGELVVGNATNDSGILSVGANDTVLTADSTTATGVKWGTISAGGMTLLSTTTLSGASTTISSIDQTYTNLQIVFRNMFGTVSENVEIRPNGVAASGFYSGITNVANDCSDTIRVGLIPTTSTARNSLVLNINQYANTTHGKPTQYNGTLNQSNGSTFFYGGLLNTASAITSLTMAPGAGNFSGGTVLVYGVK